MRSGWAWLAVLVGSCGGEKQASTSGGVITAIAADPALVGAAVIVDGQRHELRTGGAVDPAFAVWSVPEIPAGTPAMQIEIPTPCGRAAVQAAVDVMQRSPDQLKLHVRLAESMAPRAVPYWIDAPPNTEIKIGETHVPADDVWPPSSALCAPLSPGSSAGASGPHAAAIDSISMGRRAEDAAGERAPPAAS